MMSGETVESKRDTESPQRIRDRDLEQRYHVSRRTGGEWLRAMLAAGVIKKVRKVFVARWSTIDAWVEGGGQMPATTRRRGAR